MLLRLRDYGTTSQDYQHFSTRFWNQLTTAEKAEFDNALHLLPTRELVQKFNQIRLSQCGAPVVRCKAKHNYPEAKKASEEEAQGLEKEILLAEGAQVMITRNIWTSKGISYFFLLIDTNTQMSTGLVNGARGVVKKIWYGLAANVQNGDLPEVVFVKCDGYSGLIYFILFWSQLMLV